MNTLQVIFSAPVIATPTSREPEETFVKQITKRASSDITMGAINLANKKFRIKDNIHDWLNCEVIFLESYRSCPRTHDMFFYTSPSRPFLQRIPLSLSYINRRKILVFTMHLAQFLPGFAALFTMADAKIKPRDDFERHDVEIIAACNIC